VPKKPIRVWEKRGYGHKFWTLSERIEKTYGLDNWAQLSDEEREKFKNGVRHLPYVGDRVFVRGYGWHTRDSSLSPGIRDFRLTFDCPAFEPYRIWAWCKLKENRFEIEYLMVHCFSEDFCGFTPEEVSRLLLAKQLDEMKSLPYGLKKYGISKKEWEKERMKE